MRPQSCVTVAIKLFFQNVMDEHTKGQLLHEQFSDADIVSHCVKNTQKRDPN